MHIPKTAGTALTKCLIDAISPEGIATGVDASIFCGIDDFDSFSKGKKGFVYKNASEIPRDVQLVSGHISASILRQAFPRGRFMTVLREPLSRTLSFWLYWRGLSDAALEPWGDEWAHQVKLSRGSFLSFIRVKSLACNNDNPATRMLLWPSKLIPSRDFIDEKLDDDIIDQALSVLSSFDFIDFIENVYFSRNLEQWLQKRVVLSRQNETTSMPDHLKVLIYSRFHCGDSLADATRHKPRGLIADVQHSAELVGAHALLGRRQEVYRQHPFAERDVAALHHGAHGRSELLAALIALEKPGAVRRPLGGSGDLQARSNEGRRDHSAKPGLRSTRVLSPGRGKSDFGGRWPCLSPLFHGRQRAG
jgi:hypothetical protein